MNLVDYQLEIAQQIYGYLTNKNECHNINLYGSHGSGKSVIAKGVAEMLLEGWKVFYIDGVNADLSPYLTWHIGTKLYSKHKVDFSGAISFGVNQFFAPSFEVGLPKIKKENYILNPSEEALLTDIKKQAGGTESILFIADNYELWDIPSLQFLQKLLMPSLKLLDEYKVSLLLISNEQPVKNMWNLLWKEKKIPMISSDNILAVLHQRGYTHILNLEDIKVCAGNDLYLALMAAEYYDDNKIAVNTFKDIMDRRLSKLSQQEQEAIRILEPLSIIDNCFSNKETAYFINDASFETMDTLFTADEYLEKAAEKSLIVGDESYCFASNKLKEYFRERLAKRAKYLHGKFAEYLKYRHPEDYFSRGKHLKASIHSDYDRSSCDAWQMLVLAFVRRTVALGHKTDDYNILSDIDELINSNHFAYSDIHRKVLDDFLQGYYSFTEFDYRGTLYYLQSINQSLLMPVLRAECQRLIVLCLLQLADNALALREAAGELYDLIEDNSFGEDEQYCRAALVLLEVYLDRQTNPSKVKVLKQKLIQKINKHIYSIDFLEIYACFNRKSALYYPAMIACKSLKDSIQFYRKYNNKSGLYMALCNYAANAIICKEYVAAENSLSECHAMVNECIKEFYPSRYKVENNTILLEYLQEESVNLKNRRLLISSAKKAIRAFSKISAFQKDEVSHVIYLNHLGLSILCDVKGWDEELKQAKQRMEEADVFYQYYIHDLVYAGALLRGDIDVAKEELTILKKLEVPLLFPYKAIFDKRRQIQENLLETPDELDGDAVKYHRLLIEKCAHIQDASCHFYGRGFLLSDLQFLSF